MTAYTTDTYILAGFLIFCLAFTYVPYTLMRSFWNAGDERSAYKTALLGSFFPSFAIFVSNALVWREEALIRLVYNADTELLDRFISSGFLY